MDHILDIFTLGIKLEAAVLLVEIDFHFHDYIYLVNGC